MPHHSVISWVNTMTRQKEMYDAVRTEALRLMPASRAHLPNSQQRQGTHHPQNETNGAEMNEADRYIEELEELQVGASLVPALGEPVRDDEQQLTPEGRNEDKNESDAYARDFEALVAFLTSADADGGREDEIFERLTAKVILIKILIDGPPNDSATDHMLDRPELARVSGAARRCRNRRS
jgi:hypothetical protein